MSKKQHWLLKQIEALPEEEREQFVGDLLSKIDEVPDTTDNYELKMLSEYDEQAKEYYQNFGQMQGLSSGYPKIDDLAKGLVPGELTILAGKTSHGKTTLALNIANHVALDGNGVLFVTLEMTQAQITSRFMQINGGNESEDYARASALTLVQSSNELTWKHIDGLIEKAVAEMDVKLVVIDHLHYFTRELEHVAEDLGRITKELKKNAIRYNLPVILISHVRKSARGSDNSSIEDLRGSSYIAQDADVVLMVSRYRNDPNGINVKIEKNRNRGFNYENDEAKLYFQDVKIYNDKIDAIFDKPSGSVEEKLEQPTPRPTLPF